MAHQAIGELDSDAELGTCLGCFSSQKFLRKNFKGTRFDVLDGYSTCYCTKNPVVGYTVVSPSSLNCTGYSKVTVESPQAESSGQANMSAKVCNAVGNTTGTNITVCGVPSL